MALLRYAAKFDPFLSLDCTATPSTLAQSKEGRDQILPSGNLATVTSYMRKNTISVSAAAVWRNRRGRRTITINDGFPFCVVEREGDGNGPLKEESVQSVVHIKAPRGPQMKEGRQRGRRRGAEQQLVPKNTELRRRPSVRSSPALTD